MQFEASYTFPLSRAELWDILMDVHKVAACINGVESIEVIDDDRYHGTLGVKMGPVRLRFAGEVNVVERNRDDWTGVLEANAKDAKAGGGFKSNLTMVLTEANPDTTGLGVTLETTFLGRIGELGRPLIKKKIANMLDDFASQITETYATGNTR